MTDVSAALESFSVVAARRASSADPALVDAMTARMSVLNGTGPHEATGDSAAPVGEDPAVSVALAVAEQFVVDVGGVDDLMRQRLAESFRAGTFGIVQAMFVADYVPRVRWTLDRILDLRIVLPPPAAGDLWAALEDFMRTVALLDGIDPALTEVVRLRGAATHRCRLCQSLRNVTAASAGVDPTVVDAIGDYEPSGLSERTKVALRLTDAITGRPGDMDDSLVESVRGTFSRSETIELVLDVMRNAGNKIAVCLGADAAHVDDGVEFYDIDAAGEPVYGLRAPLS